MGEAMDFDILFLGESGSKHLFKKHHDASEGGQLLSSSAPSGYTGSSLGLLEPAIQGEFLNATIHIGVSACLLGENVRYDGQVKDCPVVRDVLARHAVLIPVCPETGAGMPVPREPVDLFGELSAPRMIGVESGRDWTDEITAWIEATVARLVADGLDGFVLKARSPSCGVESAALYPKLGDSPLRVDGLLAMVLRRDHPELPVVEDEDLVDDEALSTFLGRARAYRRQRLG